MNLKRPSVQLGQPEDAVRKREDIIQEAKVFCPRNLLGVTAEGMQLLE
jgi:hypothetical protein